MHIEDLSRHITTMMTQLTDIQKRLTAIEKRLAMSERAVSERAVSKRPSVARDTKPITNQQTVLLSVSEAMQHLAIGRTKFYALIKAGKFTPVKIGKATRIRRSEIEDFANKSPLI